MEYHLDTDLLVYGASHAGAERRLLLEAASSPAVIRMSAVAWYEFTRGPRTPQQLAVARAFLLGTGIIPFSDVLAERAAALFTSLGRPRRRAADIAIAATALAYDATLLTRNAGDFANVPGLSVDGTT